MISTRVCDEDAARGGDGKSLSSFSSSLSSASASSLASASTFPSSTDAALLPADDDDSTRMDGEWFNLFEQ